MHHFAKTGADMEKIFDLKAQMNSVRWPGPDNHKNNLNAGLRQDFRVGFSKVGSQKGSHVSYDRKPGPIWEKFSI